MSLFCCSCTPHSLHHHSKKLKTSQHSSKKRPKPTTSSSQFSSLLQSCIDTHSLDRGINLHCRIRETGFGKNRDLLPKLVKMYSVCGRIDLARKMFDEMPNRNLDVFAWTSMISSYVNSGDSIEAVDLFVEMLSLGLRPDAHTLSALLKASADSGSVWLVGQLHATVEKCGCRKCLSVVNALIHAYGSFGDADAARDVFDRIEQRDVVSWSSMMRACSRAERRAESLSLFSRMQFEEQLKPNELTVVSVLPACGFFSSLRKGQAIHAYVIRNGFKENPIVGSALVMMYSQCGEPDIAHKVFGRLKRRNIVVWTSMIEGFLVNGKFASAMNLFSKLQENGLKPNHITLIVVLSACSHGGMVDEGLEIFEGMVQKFGVEPGVEHYACVVDMLGRGGRFDEAEQFIRRMGVRPSASLLGCLLGACQVHGNVEMGERLAHQLFDYEPNNPANYVILSNIYALCGRWNDVQRMRQLMLERGLCKEIGCSWIEIKHEVHIFKAYD